ncbi:MAG: response regulator transcription factor [Thainema sp.]
MQPDPERPAFSHEKYSLRQFKKFFEEIGLLVVSIDGQIQFLTQQADYLLHKYALFHESRTLSDLIQHWFKYQVAQRLAMGNVRACNIPLTIEKTEESLVIRFIPDESRNQYLLLLEERELRGFTVESLELLGLTQREAEVLFWVTKDKSNAEIASILGCSKGTIRKHLENIHRKLGVQTRTAAVMTALERLGLLREPFVANLS